MPEQRCRNDKERRFTRRFLFLQTLLCLALAVACLTALSEPAGTCNTAAFAVQVLGSGGPEINDRRSSSSYLIWIDGRARLLVDMGGGALLRFEQSRADIADLQAIAFTHLHIDHSADFPSLIKASFFSARDTDLPVFGPDGNELLPDMATWLERMFGSNGGWPYMNDYLPNRLENDYKLQATVVSTDSHRLQRVFGNKLFSLSAVAVHHGPLRALAWRIDHNNHSVTISGDMNGDFHSLSSLARDTDLLIAHNAIPETATGVARNLHMPPSVIGEIARHSRTKKLVLSHLMLRTLGDKNMKATFKQIRNSYTGPTVFANDLDCFGVN